MGPAQGGDGFEPSDEHRHIEPWPDLQRGVSLDDFNDIAINNLREALRDDDPARLTRLNSIASLGREDSPTHTTWRIQLVGTAPRFGPAGADLGVVVLSARLPLEASARPEWRILDEHALAGVPLRVRVSLTDRAVIVEAHDGSLLRVYPAGVGALDAVRRPGYWSSLTPSTAWARLSTESARRRSAAAWTQGAPYLPLEVPFISRRLPLEAAPRRGFRATPVAFHIWQGRKFTRGYVSHGCITLRRADLDELAALVWASPDRPVDVTIQAAAFPNHQHPYPLATSEYWRLDNLGSAERPRFTRGSLYAISKIHAPIPAVSLIDRFLDLERRTPDVGPLAVAPPTIAPDLMP